MSDASNAPGRARRSSMQVLAVAAASLLALQGAPAASSPAAPALSVQVYRGGFATVNSFIFSNGRSLVVMDVQRTASEARKLAAMIRSKHLPLADILISHGHTDHFTGMAVLHAEFPAARIVVCSEAIKRDIENYAIYMDRGGATGAEPALDPALRPKAPDNPGGFDYEHSIHVLRGNELTLPGGGTLRLTCDYPPTEAPHMTTVYSPDLGLFVADLCYNGVHAWMGDDISDERIAAWRGVLVKLSAKYAAADPTIYPGHGAAGDMRLLDRMIRYIDDFVRTTSTARSRREAQQRMETLYPDYQEADFFLRYSIENHVR